MEAAVCLQAHGICDDSGGVNTVRQARGISNDDIGVGRGQGIDDAYKGLEKTAETAII